MPEIKAALLAEELPNLHLATKVGAAAA